MTLIIGLLVAGVILIIAEIFVPGMIAGVIGALCLVAGIVLAFMQGPITGLIVLLFVAIFGGVLFWVAVSVFPRTVAGRKLMLQADAGDWHGYKGGYNALVGKTGVTLSLLRPSGMAQIGNDRVDVVTAGELIDKGVPIRVIEVQGNRIVVARDETPKKEPEKEPPAPRTT